MRKRWLQILALAAVLIFGGCAVLRALLPEKYAVNAPIANSLFGWGGEPPAGSEVSQRLKVPPEYEIALYALLPGARMLLATPRGDLLVSLPRDGRVVLLARDKNDDGLPDETRDLFTGLSRPHGLALSADGWLYIGEGSAIGRVRFDVAAGTTQGAIEYIVTGLPEGGNHWSRNVGIGPDGDLYVTVGSSCNVCIEQDERRAAMLRYAPDGSGFELYARGLRNAVDFAWRPGSGELFATDCGQLFLADAALEGERSVGGEAVAARVQLRHPHDDELLRGQIDGALVVDLTEERQQCPEQVGRVGERPLQRRGRAVSGIDRAGRQRRLVALQKSKAAHGSLFLSAAEDSGQPL